MAIITDIYKDGSYWINIEYVGRFIYLEKLGYKIPKVRTKWGKLQTPKGTRITVRLEHLKSTSSMKVTKVCDHCGIHILNQAYGNIIKSRAKTDGTDRCFSCGKYYGAKTYKYNAPYEKSLASNFPELLSSWHYKLNEVDPESMFAYSDEIVWWCCPDCGSDYDIPIKERTYSNNNCPYCSGKRVNHTNCLWTTDPDKAAFLWNPEDGYNYTRGNRSRLDFKCKECGNKIDQRVFVEFKINQSLCNSCSDGVSYPEKFLINVLSQLNVKYKFQKSIKGADENGKIYSRKYDFYISLFKCIVETHGKQHYREHGFAWKGGRSLQEEQENDKLKERLAKHFGIDKYVVIDCSESEMNFIRNNVLESELSLLFDLSVIDWTKCHEYACKSQVKRASELWVDLKNTNLIAIEMGIDRRTVINYLKQAAVLSWCDYNPQIEKVKNSRLNGRQNNKPVYKLSVSGEIIEEFRSATDAAKKVNLSLSAISSVCVGRIKLAGGYKWIYKEDIEKR